MTYLLLVECVRYSEVCFDGLFQHAHCSPADKTGTSCVCSTCIASFDNSTDPIAGTGLNELLITMEGSLAKKQSNRNRAEEDLLLLVEKMIQESGDAESFNARVWLKGWLSAPNPALNFNMPNSYLGTKEGEILIADLLKKMQSGAFA